MRTQDFGSVMALVMLMPIFMIMSEVISSMQPDSESLTTKARKKALKVSKVVSGVGKVITPIVPGVRPKAIVGAITGVSEAVRELTKDEETGEEKLLAQKYSAIKKDKCFICGRTFRFNAELVPLIEDDYGVFRPVCKRCIELINKYKDEFNLKLIPVHPHAYETNSSYLN